MGEAAIEYRNDYGSITETIKDSLDSILIEEEKKASDKLQKRQEGAIDENMIVRSTIKRRLYESNATLYFSTGDNLAIIERLVEGADVKDGFLGTYMNRTSNRMDVLQKYFHKNTPTIANDEDYERLKRTRDKLQKKTKSRYWTKKLEDRHPDLQEKAGEILRGINRALNAYEENRSVVTAEPRSLKLKLYKGLVNEMAAITGESLNSTQSMHTYVAFVHEVIKKGKELSKLTGERLSDEIMQKVMLRTAKHYPEIEFKTDLTSEVISGLFNYALNSIEQNKRHSTIPPPPGNYAPIYELRGANTYKPAKASYR